jgi:hypothetical protein
MSDSLHEHLERWVDQDPVLSADLQVRARVWLWNRSQAGLPDFSWHNIPKQGKIYQVTTTLQNGQRIFQMAVKYSKWPYNIPTFPILRPSKICPNLDFWFENIPFGNPGLKLRTVELSAWLVVPNLSWIKELQEFFLLKNGYLHNYTFFQSYVECILTVRLLCRIFMKRTKKLFNRLNQRFKTMNYPKFYVTILIFGDFDTYDYF